MAITTLAAASSHEEEVTHGRHLKGIMGLYFNFNLVKESPQALVRALRYVQPEWNTMS
ncbi:hypothetical protein ACS0TY_027069 [Phlomoides rotata]